MLASDTFCNIFARDRGVSETHIVPKLKQEAQDGPVLLT